MTFSTPETIQQLSEIQNTRLKEYKRLDQALSDYLPPSKKISHDHYAAIVGEVTINFRELSASFNSIREQWKLNKNVDEGNDVYKLFTEVQMMEKHKLEQIVNIQVLKTDSALGFRDYTEQIAELMEGIERLDEEISEKFFALKSELLEDA
ncbi:hypothetical protein HK098_006758 [Nowakowskiella sp. JEL0407]|nr:hypothetical protein HK098_006758 [Nowakowskiella sp. JEL0407]